MAFSVYKNKLSHLAVGCALLAFLWGVAALYALHTVIPFNAVVLPFERDLPVRSLTPEGWAFFTRNPREKQISAYRRVNGTW
jgi:hypothetical protein